MTSDSSRTQVLELLRGHITSLRYQPGEAISDKQIAHELGISRTPVRESLIVLQEENLVEVYPRVGTFVTLVEIQHIRDAQFLREAIETSSLSDFSASPAAIEQLHENLQLQQSAAAAEDHERFFELDDIFHRILMTAADHERAWNTVNAAKAHMDRARRLSLGHTRPLREIIDQHRSIADALEDGEAAAAKDRLRSHLRAVFDDIAVIRAEFPHFFADLASEALTPRVTRRLRTI